MITDGHWRGTIVCLAVACTIGIGCGGDDGSAGTGGDAGSAGTGGMGGTAGGGAEAGTAGSGGTGGNAGGGGDPMDASLDAHTYDAAMSLDANMPDAMSTVDAASDANVDASVVNADAAQVDAASDANVDASVVSADAAQADAAIDASPGDAGSDTGVDAALLDAGADGESPDSGTAPVCGDGHLSENEACDDNNAYLCDGCESCEVRTVLSVPAAAYAVSSSLAGALSTTGEACYELWARVDGSVADAVYLSSTSSGSQSHFLLRCTPALDQIQFAVENGSPPVSAVAHVACDDGLWHHVAGCRSVTGSNVSLSLFWDGIPVASATGLASKVATPAPVFIGGVTYGQDGLGGEIDEVRVSSSLRYTAAFVPARRHTTDADTVALYHFDEGSGGAFEDASGNGHDGTLTGTAYVDDHGYRTLDCYPSAPAIILGGASSALARSWDFGATWETINATGISGDIENLEAGGGRLVATTSDGHMFVSNTLGETWTQAPTPPPSVAGHAASDLRYLAGRWLFGAVGGAGTIHQSLDGSSWSQAYQSNATSIYNVVSFAQSGAHLLASTRGEGTRAMIQSGNGGQSWGAEILSTNTNMPGAGANCATLLVARGDAWYALGWSYCDAIVYSSADLWRNADPTTTWSNLNPTGMFAQGLAIGGDGVSSVLALGGSGLYACTDWVLATNGNVTRGTLNLGAGDCFLSKVVRWHDRWWFLRSGLLVSTEDTSSWRTHDPGFNAAAVAVIQ